jgi:predicted deacylase
MREFLPASPAPRQQPKVALQAPDLSPYARGDEGIPFALRLGSRRPGPTVVINALMHGNEISGAVALAALLERQIRPERGTLWLTFANVAAYARFDPARPWDSRFVEEDMNRLWHDDVLDAPATTSERRRIRELWPVFQAADYVLDLHSMQAHGPPLLLAGPSQRGRDLANAMAYPTVVVADAGHSGGSRLIDATVFADPAGKARAVLLEAGQHWAKESAAVAHAACLRFLAAVGCIGAPHLGPLLPPGPLRPQQVIEVSRAVEVENEPFIYARPVQALEVVPRGGTVIATDGPKAIRTPFDDCVLVMPTATPRRGQTAVRLGRFVT